MATAVAYTLAYLLAYFASVAISGYVVFSPFRVHLESKPAQGGRFQIMDLLAIFIPIQIGLAALKTIFADVNWYPELAVLVATAFFVAIFLAWLYGVRLLSRINVNNAAKRVAFLGVVVPLGFLTCATSFLFLVLAESTAQALVRLLVIVTLLLGLRWLGSWVLSQRSSDPRTHTEFN
jgi:hypothetical protein